MNVPGLDDPHDTAVVEAPMTSGHRGRFVPLRVALEWRDRAAAWGFAFGLIAGVVLGWLFA